MNYISLFSGIEAASCAWEPMGWEPVAFSEIDPFPCRVLETHYPDVPNLGDITEIDWSPYRGAIDIVVGGSPCQSFSIAGNRESLGGESRLMWEYIRACNEIRPRWIVWENVPGVLHTKDDAYTQLLESLEECGYSLAWRVLDAQFFGVAQRRRRVFLVGHIGNGGAPAAVLFEPESMLGDIGTSRAKRAELASRNRRGVGTDGQPTVIDTGYASTSIEKGFAPALTCRHEAPIAFAQNTRDEVRIQGDGTISGALSASPGMKQTTYVLQTANTNANGSNVSEDVAYTLDTSNTNAVAAPVMLKLRHTGSSTNGKGGEGALWGEDVSFTLATSQDQTLIYGPARRLTPLECERLQGFPDGWTAIEGASDRKRYKALGNSMAVPVMRWIGERIAFVDGVLEGME